ncbi:MAG: hypothetical protein AB8B55_06775 [Mariniblastus sp.]
MNVTSTVQSLKQSAFYCRLMLVFAATFFVSVCNLQTPCFAVVNSGTKVNKKAELEANPSSQSTVKIGLGGNVKLGKWTPIFIDVPAGLAPTRFEVSVIDGDDTPVNYSGDLIKDATNPNHFQAFVRIGRTYGEVSLRLFDSSGAQVDEILDVLRNGGADNEGEPTTVSKSEYQKSTRAFILTFEQGSKMKQTIDSMSMGGREDRRIVIACDESDQLPVNWLGYDSVETIVLVTSDLDRIKNLTPQQIDSIEAWVRRGGKLVISMAKNSEALLSDGGLLARFSPGDYAGVGEVTVSKRLEAFADSREQLIPVRGEPIEVSTFNKIIGREVLSDGKGNVLITKQAFGLGQLHFVMLDLDSKRIVNWVGFGTLVNKLVASNRRGDEEENQTQGNRGSSVTHFGYQDLIGQLKAPLEKFTLVKFVMFTWVAVLIGLYILCIGPGDYFFLRKFTKKMELTWITFPLLSLLFCGLAIWISQLTRPDKIQLNQLEIIDLDSIDGRSRGTVWTNLYSPASGSCSVELDTDHDLGFKIDSEVLSWHGLPGDGLGGMLTVANSGLLKTDYSQTLELSSNGQDFRSKMIGLPLQVSSTKPIFTRWWSDNPVPVRSRLKLNPRLQQITGTVTNPFDFTLYNCRLVFENWAYVLDRPFEPGQTFDIATNTDEKTLKGLLTRKILDATKKNRSNNSPWDPQDMRIRRIADMMMFYDAAGGSNYTGLTHDYQPNIDVTEQLDLKRAILVGEVQSQGAVLKINGERTADKYDNALTIIRVFYPVEYSDAKK